MGVIAFGDPEPAQRRSAEAFAEFCRWSVTG